MSYSGKQFEQNFKDSFKGSPYDKGLMRLFDVTSGYSGQATICDFLLYSYPNLFYLELKAEKTANLPFSNITRHQYEGLLEKADYEGAIPGIIVYYYTYDCIYFIPITVIRDIKSQGRNSINIDMCEKYAMPMVFRKKRVNVVIDTVSFVKDAQNFKSPEINLKEDKFVKS